MAKRTALKVTCRDNTERNDLEELIYSGGHGGVGCDDEGDECGCEADDEDGDFVDDGYGDEDNYFSDDDDF